MLGETRATQDKERIILVCKLKGGLGNQMFQYAAARNLSRQTRRELVLDVFSGFESDTYLRQFALGSFGISARLLPPEQAKQAASRRLIRSKLVRELEAVCKNHAGLGYIGPFLPALTAGKFYLDGYWQSERYFVESADVIASEFICATDISETGKSIRKDIEARQSVSVHVRRRDYPVLCSSGYYRTACQLVLKRMPDADFFFFGDDIEWIKGLLADIQFGLRYRIVESQLGDLEEFELMRACKHHVIANSTFSWWAAWLSEAARKESLIVAPSSGWSSKRDLVRNLVPSRWVALPHGIAAKPE
jgi:hypothetical protein